MRTNLYKVLPFLMMFFTSFFLTTLMNAQPGAHDPSRIIKNGSKYYIFCTGQGIVMYSSTSTSFTTWTQEKSPFASGNPSWISTYVSGFGGFYWAPEIIYMNSKYYLYYSVSMGAKPCAIGVVTTPSLTSPVWTDQGMVVYSNTSTAYGSIDPDVFFDQSGKLWLAYGSHLNGIVLAQLNTTTGKPLNSTRYNIAKPSANDAEGAAVIYNGGYYYVFYNRLTCCAGYNSSYTMFMGRSTSVTGPYTDKNGVSLTGGAGGSVFLTHDGRRMGPGHFGLGEGKLTYHYYDAFDNGAPKLAVSTLSWSGGWPVAATMPSNGSTPTAGTYIITNRNSGKVLDVANCLSTDGANVQQWTNLNNNCQKWVLASAGNGYYTIKNANSGKMLDVVNGAFASGTNVDQWTSNSMAPQQWAFVSTNGYYRIVNRCNGKDLEVAGAATTDGANIQVYAYNGCYCQQWSLTATATSSMALDVDQTETQDGISISPIPAATAIKITGAVPQSSFKVYTLSGNVVMQGKLQSEEINIESLSKGVYFINLQSKSKVLNLRFIKE